MPGLGTPSTKNPAIRKVIIDRVNMIYYQWLDNGDINILRVIDRRSNPTDNPFE
jgi:plasmid stabilization system protein ParE